MPPLSPLGLIGKNPDPMAKRKSIWIQGTETLGFDGDVTAGVSTSDSLREVAAP